MAVLSTTTFWIAVNKYGDAALSMEGASEAREALLDGHGGTVFRTVKLTMALPEIPEVTVVEVLEQIEVDATGRADR